MLFPFLLLVTIALYAFFFGISLLQLIAPWERHVSGQTFVNYHQAIDPYMAKWAKILAQLQLVLTLVVLWIFYQRGLTWSVCLLGIALGMVIISVLVAIRGNVPLNQVMKRWSATELPVNWLSIRDQWLTYHRWRAWVNMIGFIFLLASLLASQEHL
ncbi:hypothetical protein IC229_35065 [Spirosoma sp. BT702]|uniref:DUF1772 domain-containing protein n=1 Tax=Spirosoma profusum TaxID=2771354 RepID=A0A927AWT9_9BACT|nr:hypothetical protein [Spirosoma profusum]MBD2705872.1 hypothetical protein [Spirosoma profusum]